MAENDMQLTTSTSTTNHDHSLLSAKTISEGDNNGLTLNTLESLRGRLLAERQASKAARDEAESLANKFLELEKELREEIKLRDRAQRQLQFLKKKLESFNISFPQGHSYSSEKCENSRGSSLCSSSSTHSEAAHETKPHTTNPTLPEASVLMQNNDPNQILENSRNDDNRLSHSSQDASPENICHNPNPSYEDLNNDEKRNCSLTTKSSVIENDDDDGDFVDNSLALVPVTLPATSLLKSQQRKRERSQERRKKASSQHSAAGIKT